jgi:RimJ/RimL family protein N-acetyltransferase/catechol 2,3-dioxygenase-like lactoylglutathione lyase family enzyme
MIASARLRYQALEPSLLEDLHRLVTDAHIRRYMMDGITHPRAWTAARIADSERLQAERGVGLWLARRAEDGDLVGFCGFLGFTSREPELLYALLEAHAGQGYGLEMARAAIAEARRHPGFGVIRAGVDAVNSRSLRLLEKLGFQRRGAQPGAFGECLLLHLPSVVRLDHVQLAMPAGREPEARSFYQGLLGLPERPKPERLAARGGAWFESATVKVHLGVEADFRPARKAHPALIVDDLPAALERLRRAGLAVPPAEPGESVYVDDPFGNRLELIAGP